MERIKLHPLPRTNRRGLKGVLSLFVLCVVMVLTASPLFAAPEPLTVSTPPAASDVSTTGYTLTVQYWLSLEKTARETEKALQDIYTQTIAAIPDDPARLRSYFAQKLADKFPGSTFNGVMGTLVLPDKMRAHFNDKFMVDRMEEVGRINVNYFLKQGQFVCSNGTNSVGGIINKANPSESVFTKVDIDAMKTEAEKILGNRTVTVNSPEEAVINDAYQLLSVTNNSRMDTYAGELVVSPEAQQVAMGLAEKGYKQRHPGEYQAGGEGSKKVKSVAKEIEIPSDQSFSSKMIMRFLVIGGLFFLCALFVKLSWHFVGAGFRNLKKNASKKRRSSRASSSSSPGTPSGSSPHRSSSRSQGSSRTHSSSRVHGSSRSRESSPRPRDSEGNGESDQEPVQ